MAMEAVRAAGIECSGISSAGSVVFKMNMSLCVCVCVCLMDSRSVVSCIAVLDT